MILNYSIFFIVSFCGANGILNQEPGNGLVTETFRWVPISNSTNLEWELTVIGKKVSWAVAQAICTSLESGSNESAADFLDLEDTADFANSTRTNWTVAPNSRLAHLENDNMMIWLARMLSESNYRYDGLWVGGHRSSSGLNWTWTAINNEKEVPIPLSQFLGSYPEWYKSQEHHDVEKNCLAFDRVGHDLPILVPMDCQLTKPFICSRTALKKIPKKIVEGISVSVDGYRYTIFGVDHDPEDLAMREKTSGVRRLNGGGVKWREARFECRRRGQYLASVLSNAAAAAIAGVMMKNRPSMESVWLAGWSLDGRDWTWSPTGFELPSARSVSSQYPPWLLGHPIPNNGTDEFYQRRARCLILDRHLCPNYIGPVFLDLDCEKERPFVCQDGAIQRYSFQRGKKSFAARSIRVGKEFLEFSAAKMTWNEGREYCASNGGRIASVVDSETLTAVLDKMAELYLDHIWVGGRTEMRAQSWRWFDETGRTLNDKGVGVRSSWCFGNNEEPWPKAEPNTCLNLDREGGFPLFYGLPCDFAKQQVLCTIVSGSRSLSEKEGREFHEESEKQSEGNIDKLSSVLKERIDDLATANRSGILFIIDDSPDILSIWLAQELKLVATVLRKFFPLSEEHPMGLLTLSAVPRSVLAINQTDECSVFSYMKKILRSHARNGGSEKSHDVSAGIDDYVRAMDAAADMVKNSGLQRVAIIFIVDGNHKIKDRDDGKEQPSIEQKITNLKSLNQEMHVLFVGQIEKTSTSLTVFRQLFNDSTTAEQQIYTIRSYKAMSKIVDTINSTATDSAKDLQCEESQWIVPTDVGNKQS